MIRCLFAMLLGLSTTAHAQREEDGPGRLGEAIVMLERAASISQSDPARARTIAADAAVLLNAELTASDRENPAAQRALGNANLLAGDLGRAVLAYRRAAEADPSDPRIRASLAHARSLVTSTAPSNTATRAESIVRAARPYLPRTVLFWTGAASLLLACLTLAVHLHRRIPFAAWSAAALIAVSTLAAGALTLDDRLSHDSDAVVMLRSVTARTGPDEVVYPPALETPVPAGSEGRIRDTRPGWALVALGSAEAWIPADRFERVHP